MARSPDVVNKPGNIAGFAIILSTVMIALAMFAPLPADVPRRELFVPFFGLLTSAFGFLFGKTTR
jgi:hypothetical protein